MKIIVHSNYPILNKNGNMFRGIGNISVKHFLEQMEDLKKIGKENNYDFYTSDEILIENADSILFIDMPSPYDSYFKKAIALEIPIYLYVWESIIINQRNFVKTLHSPFRKIFTYDDSLIDNKRYIKISYSFRIPKSLKFQKKVSPKFCCMIAGNKSSKHPLELYSERKKIIEWFEINSPKEFSLYGQGWNKIIPPRSFTHRIYNKFSFINFYRPKSYVGVVDNKIDKHSEYTFSICLENSTGVDGYITEKIFDVLQSGSIPIYFGAPNVSDFIPKKCFIDYKQFVNLEDLVDYLNALSDEDIFSFKSNIEELFEKKKLESFTTTTFANTIIKNI